MTIMETKSFLYQLWAAVLIASVLSLGDEPKCHSRFDYDYKLLQKVTQLEDAFADVKASCDELRQKRHETKTEKTGCQSMYIRWGRPDCPGNGTELVYRGFTAGLHNMRGGGTSILCLPEEPTWARYIDGEDSHRSKIWGAEIYMDEPSEGKVFEQTVNGLDLPCAVCLTPRAITHMFPGRASCFPGWSLEYTGYLMSNIAYRPHNMEYICSDANPTGVPHGAAENKQDVLSLVEGRCGSLPCPPYVEGREITCTVCSV